MWLMELLPENVQGALINADSCLFLKLVKFDNLRVATGNSYFKQVCQVILNVHKIWEKKKLSQHLLPSLAPSSVFV